MVEERVKMVLYGNLVANVTSPSPLRRSYLINLYLPVALRLSEDRIMYYEPTEFCFRSSLLSALPAT